MESYCRAFSRAVLAGEPFSNHLIVLDHSQQLMLLRVQHKSNLGQKRIGVNLLKYKEEQEMVISEKRMSLVEGIAARGRPPETRLSSRVAVAAQPINKRIVDRSEQRTTKQEAIKTRPFMLPSPIYHQPFLLLTLSSL